MRHSNKHVNKNGRMYTHKYKYTINHTHRDCVMFSATKKKEKKERKRLCKVCGFHEREEVHIKRSEVEHYSYIII